MDALPLSVFSSAAVQRWRVGCIAKSEDSTGEVDLDPDLLAMFQEWEKTVSGPFVIAFHALAKTRDQLHQLPL
ncbi:MAG: hypothetical protein ACO1TE_12380 [Prosthecobacter sp.]